MRRCPLLGLVCLLSTACSSFTLGGIRTPVGSASRLSTLTRGVHGAVEQSDATIHVRASRLCNVETQEDRAAGYRAEQVRPHGGEEAKRREHERDATRMGPITPGALRGVDEAGVNDRTLASEIPRALSAPWLLVAAGGGVLQTLLCAKTRVAARLDRRGEHSEARERQTRVPCRGAPAEGAVVTLLAGRETRDLGRTDARGELTVDLTELPPAWASLSGHATVLVDGERVGLVDLAPVAAEAALRAARRDARDRHARGAGAGTSLARE